MSFAGIIGHDGVIHRLRAAIRNERVAHGYIFAGPQGAGKTLVAREFARALLCEKGGDDACDDCTSCRTFEHGNHPSFEVISPTGDGRQIKVEAIEELHRMLAYGARGAAYRVILFEPADRMNVQTENKFLKSLEEPPEGIVFILVTAQPSRLLETIISRCQMVRFGPVGREKVEAWLIAQHGAEPDAARLAAAISEGSPGKAAPLLESDLAQRRDEMFEAIRVLQPRNASDFVETFVKQLGKGALKLHEQRDAAHGLFLLMLYIYRDLLAIRLAPEDYPLYGADRREALARVAEAFDTDDLLAIIDKLTEAMARVDMNVNLEILLDDLLAQIARLTPAPLGA